MKKTVYLFLMLLTWFVFNNTVQAQESRVNEAIQNSPFIIDGITCGMKFLKDIEGKNYVSYPIIVNKILKGDKSIHAGDTIELISEMPSDWGFIEDTMVYTPTSIKPSSLINGIKLGIKARGIYFLKKEIFQGVPIYGLYINKNDGYFGIKTSMKIENNIGIESNKVIYGFSIQFTDFNEFSNFLQRKGLGEVKADVSEYLKKKENAYSEGINKNTNKTSISQDERRANYNAAINRILDRKNKIDVNFHEKSSESIDIEIKNETILYDSLENADFYEFDIFVTGNSSNTYIDNLAFVIGYNTNAFNVNIVGNQGIEIIPSTEFSTPTYDNPMNGLSDELQGDSFRFRLGTSLTATSWNRVKLTIIPQKLVHVKMKIVSCNNYSSDTQFLDIDNVSVADVYSDNASIDPAILGYFGYDANYIQPAPFQLCSPLQIIDFTPKIISSGTESILTIIGKGFGTHRGNTQVIFKAADDGGTSEVSYLNNYDYINSEWSDTIIKITLPYSTRDSILTDEYPLGSGKISISKGNDFITSSQELNIKFANDSYTAVSSSDPSNVLAKIPFRQVTFNRSPYNYADGHSREFYLDTSISNYPDMEAIIRKALRDWSCETGINWVIVDTTHTQGYIEDGKSVIFIDDDLTEGTIGHTKPTSLGFCYDNSTDKRFAYAKEIDMGFARIPDHKSWDFDTVSTNDIENNKYDFYEVVMHELGHAHYLGHINNENDIMYYGSTYGTISSINRKHIFTSPNSIEGGNYIMDKSLSIILDGCDGVELSTSHHPTYCGTMSTNDLINNSFKITAYPNPFNSSITLKMDDNQLPDATISYEITDISGKTIVNSTFKDNYTIDLSQLNSGVYLLKINDNNNYINKTIKIIKQ